LVEVEFGIEVGFELEVELELELKLDLDLELELPGQIYSSLPPFAVVVVSYIQECMQPLETDVMFSFDSSYQA